MTERWVCSCVFFFFQAEDGIRDHCVTGVQTCALPINSSQAEDGIRDHCVTGVDRKSTRLNSSHTVISYAVFCLRSEEHTSELQSHTDLGCRLLLVRKPDQSPISRVQYAAARMAGVRD